MRIQLPQPFRNMYENYQHINDDVERMQRIRAISKDCFRLLLALPIAIYNAAVTNACMQQKIPGWACLLSQAVLCSLSPASYSLALAGLSNCIACSLLISSVARKSLPLFVLSGAFGLLGYVFSHYYESGNQEGFENRILTPLSNQFARAFI